MSLVYRICHPPPYFYGYMNLHRQACRPGERKIEDGYGYVVVYGGLAKKAVWFLFKKSTASKGWKRRTPSVLASID